MFDITNLIQDFIKKHQIQIPDDKVIEETWVQVGKLSVEDDGRRRSVYAKATEREREFKVLMKKAAALKAQNDAESDEWWMHVHKVHGLPEGNYHITDDGRIFCEPKNK